MAVRTRAEMSLSKMTVSTKDLKAPLREAVSTKPLINGNGTKPPKVASMRFAISKHMIHSQEGPVSFFTAGTRSSVGLKDFVAQLLLVASEPREEDSPLFFIKLFRSSVFIGAAPPANSQATHCPSRAVYTQALSLPRFVVNGAHPLHGMAIVTGNGYDGYCRKEVLRWL